MNKKAVCTCSTALVCALLLLPLHAMAQTDALAIPPAPAEKYAVSAGGVDMRTGQYAYSNVDLAAEGPGGIRLVRTNGGSDVKYWDVMGQFTNNWFIYATYQSSRNGEATFTVGGARGQQFVAANSNNFSARATTAMDTLQAVPTGTGALDRYLVYTASDGTKITFRPQGAYYDSPRRLRANLSQQNIGYFASKIEQPDGVTYTLTYDEPTSTQRAYLRRVTSNTGYVLIFELVANPLDKMVSRACLFNAAVESIPAENSCDASTYKTSYTYSANGYMNSSVDALGNTSQYTSSYSENEWQTALNSTNRTYTWVEKFYRPGANLPYLTNSMLRAVSYAYVQRQEFLAGAGYAYSWHIESAGEAGEEFGEVAGGTATRSDGTTVKVNYQVMTRAGSTTNDARLISSGPSSIVNELGETLSSDYCITITYEPSSPFTGTTGCAIVSAKYWQYPEGNRSEYKYTSWGSILEIADKPKPGSNLPSIIRTFTYDCSSLMNCDKPTSATDALGNTTTATYSTVHGGLLKKTHPADPGGVHPETRYAYTQANAWVSNGGVLSASSPIWVLQSEQFCKTSAADANGNCTAGTADEVRTNYEYEAGSASKGSNLRLLGRVLVADGKALRTCMTYDKWGRKVSETAPNANLAGCS